MDELKYGQLDTGSWSGRCAIGSANVCAKVSNTDLVMGSEEYTYYIS